MVCHHLLTLALMRQLWIYTSLLEKERSISSLLSCAIMTTIVKSYPEWQAYLREYKPKVVGLWGKNDPFFASPGAEAFKRDVPDADISIIDAGHFLNESHPQEIIKALKKLA